MEEILLNKKENNLEINYSTNLLVNEQKKFIETSLGKVINEGVNIGLRAVLPDLIEEQIIDVKDILMKEGLKDGVKTIIDDVTDFGKNISNLFNGKIENVSQFNNIIKNTEVVNTTSDVLGLAIDYAKNKKLVDSSTATLLKKGKNIIADSVSNHIEEMLNSQNKAIENLNKSINKWEKAYKSRNIDNMKKEYEKIKIELNKILPLEKTIKSAREIENIHNLIMNNGNNFELSKDELILAKKLS